MARKALSLSAVPYSDADLLTFIDLSSLNGLQHSCNSLEERRCLSSI